MTTLQNEYGIKYGESVTLVLKICGACGVPFGVPEALEREYNKDHTKGWHCPNGHNRIYLGKTEAQKERELREQRERELSAMRESRDYYLNSLAGTQRILASTRGVVTRKKRELSRVKNGVCPCCNRSFVNLRNHMSAKHPDFQKTAEHEA